MQRIAAGVSQRLGDSLGKWLAKDSSGFVNLDTSTIYAAHKRTRS